MNISRYPRPRSKSAGLAYIEVMVALVLVVVALVPALSAMQTSTRGSAPLCNIAARDAALRSKMEEVLAKPFDMLKFDPSASTALSNPVFVISCAEGVALHHVTRDWTEAATWSTSDGSTAWSQAGGDVLSPAIARTAFSGPSAWLKWDVTALVDGWVKGSTPNHGVQIRFDQSISGLKLASSDHATTILRPKLTVITNMSTTPITLQPGTEGIDTYVQQTSTANNGALDSMFAEPGTSFPMLKFDLSTIPPGAQVTSATLSVYATAGSSGDQIIVTLYHTGCVALYRVAGDWTEAATWSTSDGSTAWSHGGSDVFSPAIASTAFSGPSAWLNWDVTALVDGWVKGSTPNQGVQIRVDESISGLKLASSDHATTTLRPKLTVTYLPTTTITLQPGTGGIDTYVQETSTANNGALNLMSAEPATSFPMLKFDLSTIPPGAQVTSATLSVYATTGSGGGSCSDPDLVRVRVASEAGGTALETLKSKWW